MKIYEGRTAGNGIYTNIFNFFQDMEAMNETIKKLQEQHQERRRTMQDLQQTEQDFIQTINLMITKKE